MTATETQERERQTRISARWNTYPHYAYDEVVAAIDAELAQEAYGRAEGEAWVKDMTDGMRRLWSCMCCGENRGPGVRDGLCPDCRPVYAQVVAERNAAQTVNGHTRRRLVEAFLDRKGT